MAEINITQDADREYVWHVECECGFFGIRGSRRMHGYFPAKRVAKDHNKIGHRNKYSISTEGSELF